MKNASEIKSEKKKLYFNQKKLLDVFLIHKTITQAQYNKSYICMSEKMEMDYYLNYKDKRETEIFEIIKPFEIDFNDFCIDFGVEYYPTVVKYNIDFEYILLKETRNVVCVLNNLGNIVFCDQKYQEEVNMQVLKN